MRRGQAQVVAAVILALATATTVVAVNSTNTSNITGLPAKLNEFFFRTVEIWADTFIEFDVSDGLLLWLRMDNGTGIPNRTLELDYSAANTTGHVNLTTGLGGNALLPLVPGNYSVNVSFNGSTYLMPSRLDFNITIVRVNQTGELNGSVPAGNETAEAENVSVDGPVNESDDGPEEIPKLPELGVLADFPEKVSRDGSFNVTLEIFNSGEDDARTVMLEWTVPDGFTILSPDCGAIPAGESCIFDAMLSTSLEASPGQKEVRLKVIYE